jgi:putative serine protease PepD
LHEITLTMTDRPSSPDDDTQPHDPRPWMRPDPAPSSASAAADPGAGFGSGPASSDPFSPAAASFSPTPEPRHDWSGPTWAATEPTPERWFETSTPTPAVPVATTPVRRGSGGGTVLAAALAAAILASGGTVVALTASGALDKPAVQPPAAGGPNSTSVKQPITVDENSAIIDVAAKAGPSVVRIFTKGVDPNSPTSQEQDGVGSGIIFDSNGWILTNRHVVAGTTDLTVQLKEGLEYPATVYGIDTLTDLAIVKIDATGLPAATVGDSDGLKVGELVVAIGSPLGSFDNSVTSGIDFSIPINIASPIMRQALAGAKLSRPYIGIHYEAINAQTAKVSKLPVDQGAWIHSTTSGSGPSVTPRSPAEAAGVKDGDIVTKINDQVIDTVHPLDAVLSQFSPGDKVTLTILRDGTQTSVVVTLGVRPANLQ